MLRELSKFITEDDVMDLVTTVIMDTAVKGVADGLISGFIVPLMGAVTADVDTKELAVTPTRVKLQYGLSSDTLVKFTIIVSVVFTTVKAVNRGRDALHKEPTPESTTKICPYCEGEIDITATRCPHCTSELTG